ncbi:PTS sugar transporter subunit IIC [Streptococcus sp. sy010]|uniref:PTS sugar transporter subunit IIC n=1 Tax=Streptococcus sp. sy010 TaxID=2600148 RepID=UPI0011B49805|nr:PTS sugar transporter subunit IIC [Streptococcus sp. sy010]TWT16404.1 PTS sugar transporter subunit IIC [Streptococcus sp. sy010]
MTATKSTLSVGQFLNKVLNGTAIAVIVGLIPNAILAVLLTSSLFQGNSFVATWHSANVLFQATIPALMGALIALQFGFDGLKVGVVAAATYVGSGVTSKSAVAAGLLSQLQDSKASEEVIQTATTLAGSFFTAGTGDIINAMLVASLTVALLLALGDKLGSLNIIFLPILSALVATVGLYTLPHVKGITTQIGVLIQNFTELQPYLMSMLICISFAILIVSPISTVAIGLAVGLTGISAGASAMGVAATTMVLVVHSFTVNKPGVTIAVALASMKMMMPNVFKNPIVYVNIVTTAALCSLLVPLFNITGTPASAGFGLVGLTGLFASINGGLSPVLAPVVWILLPLAIAIATRFVYTKLLKLYSAEVFKFETK